MTCFDRSTSYWIAIVYVSLLFLPKVNLFQLGEKETAGIRIDDLLLLIFSMIYFWGHFSIKNEPHSITKRFSSIEGALLLFVIFSILSYSMNQIFVAFGWLEQKAHILYALRIAEYFLFFYIGTLFKNRKPQSINSFDLTSLIKCFFIWNVFLMIFQKGGWIGQFSVVGYLPINTDRVTGIASFPSEAGMLLNMLFAYLIYLPKQSISLQWLPAYLSAFIRQTSLYWIFLLFLFFAIITGSRIAIIAMVMIFLFFLKDTLLNHQSSKLKRYPSDWIYAFFFLILGTALSLMMIQMTEAVFERSLNLFSLSNLNLISLAWEQVGMNQNYMDTLSTQSHSYDLSWWIRIHKWAYALKVYYSHPECYLLGVGPGFCGAALDGGYIRLLSENGVIGCFLFWNFISKVYKQNPQIKWIIIAFLINMLFFDAYLAYKPMSLLFLISGYFSHENEILIKKNSVCFAKNSKKN